MHSGSRTQILVKATRQLQHSWTSGDWLECRHWATIYERQLTTFSQGVPHFCTWIHPLWTIVDLQKWKQENKETCFLKTANLNGKCPRRGNKKKDISANKREGVHALDGNEWYDNSRTRLLLKDSHVSLSLGWVRSVSIQNCNRSWRIYMRNSNITTIVRNCVKKRLWAFVFPSRDLAELLQWTRIDSIAIPLFRNRGTVMLSKQGWR